jgi:predicted nucleic-acid-binding protein
MNAENAARVALDTNVLVRFLTNDDAKQATRAKALITQHSVFIAATVLLETEWVLRGAYAFERPAIATFLRALLGLPQVCVAEPLVIAEALQGYEAGLDFADALHLAMSGEAQTFATFDARFVRKARGLQKRTLITP